MTTSTTMKRSLRRDELKKLVPLSDSTIYEMEKRGEFPARFALSRRCVVWDYDEVIAWRNARQEAGMKSTQTPDVRKRKVNPVRN